MTTETTTTPKRRLRAPFTPEEDAILLRAYNSAPLLPGKGGRRDWSGISLPGRSLAGLKSRIKYMESKSPPSATTKSAKPKKTTQTWTHGKNNRVTISTTAIIDEPDPRAVQLIKRIVSYCCEGCRNVATALIIQDALRPNTD